MESSCAGGDCVEGIVSLVLTLQSDVEALIKALQVLQVCCAVTISIQAVVARWSV